MYWYYKYKHAVGWTKVMDELELKVEKFGPDWCYGHTYTLQHDGV